MIFLTLVTTALALAAQQAPDFTVTTHAAKGAVVVIAAPPAGHHINVKAPMELVEPGSKSPLKLETATPTRAVFRIKGTGPHDFVVRLFLCDEHNTYCERHEVPVSWKGQDESAPAAAPAPKPQAPAATSAMPVKRKPEFGFVMNDPKAAFAQAAKEHRPLLIDFYGIWCPPCNMLDEQVFPTREFKKASKGFVKLKLDADADVSWELKGRYKVSGYPTVIFTDSSGDEISRVVGFRPKDEFLKAVGEAWASREESFAKLKAKADAGDTVAAGKLGTTYLERHEFENARVYLMKAPDRKLELREAEVGLAENAGDDKQLEALEAGVRDFPRTPQSVDWRAKLADLYAGRKDTARQEKILGDNIEAAGYVAEHPELLVGTDYDPSDMWSAIADAQEALKHPDLARQAWARCAQWYGERARAVGHANPAAERGYNLEYAGALWRSGESAKAEKVYRQLEKKYPREFTFWFGHARMHYELKNYNEATKLAEKAYSFSYGDNRLRAADLLARAYVDAGKKDDALSVLEKTISTTPLPDDKAIRTHRYFEKLQALEKKLKP